MEHGHLLAEASPKPGDRLWRQGDLRDQNDSPLTTLQGSPDGLNVNFCLAAASHPVEQDDLEFAPRNGSVHPVHGNLLIRV